ncbi:drug resistance transporter, EmrB/QacA subfamily [Actinopolymorpha cephalotaxi]|uniref:Drug resistance transporter, EmrB/QacA subfamily n=1 Tax=Actinopolymorpha cephalotaxi TaxID=504797 RepID=A0A1I3A6Y2_9ACTN|nr:MFS transporter [Actinopolymorpha cephalotaxi]NYH85315.1 EmrB/QacA subfamily drug resistance transporter [Actinopolymorpha cephalotaxi]SFH45636.1 drug resistance transporter, EmrB/QacA subfamily [Actinopolymorpha cephalotaxi]
MSSYPRRWQVLALLGIAQFMLILDVTVVAISLPLMGAELGLDRQALTWVVSAYTLTFGGLMLLGGRIADLIGPRTMVLLGLAVFTVASFATGAAQTDVMVLAGRVGQGLGAAMLSPSALSVVVRMFDGEERNRALGIWSALGGGGAAVGVLVGGLLAAGPGWSWVFFVNVPIGLAVFVVLARVLPALPAAQAGRRRSADVLGALLVTAATGSVIYAMIGAGEAGWLAPRTWILFAVGVGLYLLFGWRQRTAAAPLMDLGLLFRRPVVAGTFVIAIGTALMVAVFFLGSFYLQGHARLGPLVTGLLFLPVAVATMVGAQAGGRIIGQVGGRTLAMVGLAVAAVGLAVPAFTPTTIGVVIGVSVGAAGIGSLFVVASATALGQVAPHEAGVASGIVSTFHEFGASIGAAVTSSVAAASLATQAVGGYTTAFAVAAGAALVGAIVSGGLIPGRRPAPEAVTMPVH